MMGAQRLAWVARNVANCAGELTIGSKRSRWNSDNQPHNEINWAPNPVWINSLDQ